MDNIEAQAEGYIIGASIAVTPKDVQPGGTIHIRAVFENKSFWPACGILEIVLDGVVIFTVGDYIPYCSITDKTYVFEDNYILSSSISTGISHSIEARESDQTTVTAIDYFTVSSPPPPGQRNVSFASIPADAQIYVSEVYRGNTPLTISLVPGTYAVRAIYAGQEQAKNIQVSAGLGSMPVAFTFTQFDLGKWVSDNKWYLGATAVGIGILYLAAKKPATLRQGATKAYELAGKGYVKAKEVYQKSMMKD